MIAYDFNKDSNVIYRIASSIRKFKIKDSTLLHAAIIIGLLFFHSLLFLLNSEFCWWQINTIGKWLTQALLSLVNNIILMLSYNYFNCLDWWLHVKSGKQNFVISVFIYWLHMNNGKQSLSMIACFLVHRGK
jgi:hypothetical protein